MSKHWGKVLRIGIQCHQVHHTMYNNTTHTQYDKINTKTQTQKNLCNSFGTCTSQRASGCFLVLNINVTHWAKYHHLIYEKLTGHVLIFAKVYKKEIKSQSKFATRGAGAIAPEEPMLRQLLGLRSSNGSMLHQLSGGKMVIWIIREGKCQNFQYSH